MLLGCQGVISDSFGWVAGEGRGKTRTGQLGKLLVGQRSLADEILRGGGGSTDRSKDLPGLRAVSRFSGQTRRQNLAAQTTAMM
jgi:hypothetical protein